MTFRASFEHREDLLEAAIAEFGERGYERASINRILVTAHMSKGQLYHHFGSKEGLFLALVEWMIDRKTEWLIAHPPERADDFIAMLRTQIIASLEFAAAHPDIEHLSRTVLAERGEPIFTAIVDRFGFDPDSAFANFIDDWHAWGEFRDDVALEFIRRAVLIVVNNLPELLNLDQPADLDGRVDEVLSFLRAGLLRPGAAG